MVAKAAAMSILGSSAVSLAGGPKPQPLNRIESLNIAPDTHWFADWDVNSNPTPQDFFATPFANDGNVAAVQATLNASAAVNKPLGIKIQAPGLSTAAAHALYNTQYNPGQKAISYVFGDLEGSPTAPPGATGIDAIKNMVNQVRAGTWSNNAYVGEFDLTPLTGVGNNINDGQNPFRHGPLAYTEKDYKATKVNMANTELYPGAPIFRNRSTFDWANPQIRTGLFIAPIGTMTAVENKLRKGYEGMSDSKVGSGNFLKLERDDNKQIPWVARFNNYGNNSLDTDHNPNTPGTPFRFVPGAPLPQAGLSASQTANQMMGRGDFSAQIFHYRARGAYSINLFEPGVAGYTKPQEQDDARAGWYGGGTFNGVLDPLGADTQSRAAVMHANNIFAQKDAKLATFTLNPVIDGTNLPADGKQGFRSEQTGSIWSGVYSKNLKQLDILASNLDIVNHMIKFGSTKDGKDGSKDGKIDGYDVFVKTGTGAHAHDVWDDKSLLAPNRNQLIEAGFHRMLEFDLVTTRVYHNSGFTGSASNKQVWLLNHNYLVFTNNNRNDQGIPEPTTFGMLAAAGSMAAVCRRSRKNNA